MNWVLKIFPRFLRQSRSDVLLLAFMHTDFILLILQFERDKKIPQTCIQALHMHPFYSIHVVKHQTHSYPQMPDC